MEFLSMLHFTLVIFLKSSSMKTQIFRHKSICMGVGARSKGYALLTYPYDFEYLSLTTLSPGVNRVELAVPLKEEEKPCFQKKNNQDREQILARFVTDVANEAIHSFIGNKSNIYNGKEFQVCLEKRDTNSPSLFAGRNSLYLYSFSW